MKLIKKMAVVSMAVLALSGCTQSSISNEAPVSAEAADIVDTEDSVDGEDSVDAEDSVDGEAAAPGPDEEILDPDKLAALAEDEEVVEKSAIVDEEPVEMSMFDWEQVEEDALELFNDVDFYPATVKMSYEADEDARTIKLNWVLKNGTTEDDAMTHATDLVQKFNDILAVQVADVDFSSLDSFGGVWKQFALTVQVGTEDGTWLVDKSYAAGEEIDLKLPEYTGDGPQGSEESSGGPGAQKPAA